MKVNLGSSEHKKSFFPISLDSSTTSNFGECLPIFCHELVPNTHASFNINNAVRFGPLSFPTFGKAFLKTYAFSHKISDLYPPFDDLLAQTPFTSGSGSIYIPSSVPSVPLWFLWLSVISNCEFSIYNCSWNGVGAFSGSGEFVYSNLRYGQISSIRSSSNNTELTDQEISMSLPLWLLCSLFRGSSALPNLVTFPDAEDYYNYMFSDFSRDKLFFDNSASNLGSVYCRGSNDPNGNSRSSVLPSSSDYYFCLPSSVTGYLSLDGSTGFVKSVSSSVNFYEDDSLTDSLLVCIRLTDSGKFLRKILMGLGYQIAPLNTPVSILPIYAYFKSYFDTFAPKRFIKFEQSYFSRLINYVVNSGSSLFESIISSDNLASWSYVIDDLLSCYYTKDTDYYSSQIIGLINDYGSSLSQKYLGVIDDIENDSELSSRVLSVSSSPDSNISPYLNLSSTVSHTQAQQNILSRLTQFVNRRSVIGGKLADLLKSVFGISKKEVDDYSSYIGSNSIDVNFGDVFSTAETSEASLGEYAGKALGFGSGDTYHIDVDTHSLILAFSVIVPRTQYVQGVNPILTHVNSSDFYNPMFDGLTLLPTRRSSLYCGDSIFTHDDNSVSFGNVPIYSEYKTKSCGVLSGDLSLNSTKSSFDSFTMDEIISSYNLYSHSSSDSNSGLFYNIQYNFNSLVCGTMWRYLGRWLWLGRFDRIFVNNRLSFSDFVYQNFPAAFQDIHSTRNIVRSDDNLVVHHVVNLDLNSAMVPLSGSFMTDDLVSLNPHGVNVQSE